MRKAGKVLVVDDYEANLLGLGRLLENDDYAVLTATNGRDALEIDWDAGSIAGHSTAAQQAAEGTAPPDDAFASAPPR